MTTRTTLLERLLDPESVIVFDGAMGTMLYARGVFINQCYDELNTRAPELVRAVHAEYVQAGAEVLETNTFGANRVKLAQYGLQSTDNILTFLIDFGDQIDPRFPTAPAGPVHNAIPEPDRSVDDTTYWVDDFSREHFQEMFYGDGESMTSLYREMSSGRYTVHGDTSDWVTVPFNEASYGQTESQATKLAQRRVVLDDEENGPKRHGGVVGSDLGQARNPDGMAP